MEKTIEVKAIDKEKALKRGLNRLGVELTENEIVEVVEKVAPRKKLFGLLGTEDGIYEIIIKKKETFSFISFSNSRFSVLLVLDSFSSFSFFSIGFKFFLSEFSS